MEIDNHSLLPFQDTWDKRNILYLASYFILAIIRLAEKLDLKKGNRDSVCLPDILRKIPDNYGCYIVGYGMTKFEGNVSDELRHAPIKTVPIKECNKPEAFNQTINENLIIFSNCVS